MSNQDSPLQIRAKNIKNNKPEPLLKSPLPPPPVEQVTSSPLSYGEQNKDQDFLNEFAEHQAKLTKRQAFYSEFVQYRMGAVITLFLWFFVHDWDRAAFYAPNVEECAEMAPHIAHMIPAKTPKAIDEMILKSGDYLPLAYVVAGYLDRIGVLEKIRPTFSMLLVKEKVRGKQSARNIPTMETTGGTNGSIDLSAVTGLGNQWNAN